MNRAPLFLVAIIGSVLVACNGSDTGTTNNYTSSDNSTNSPQVSSTSPAQGTTGVSRSTSISVTFDREMDSSSITANYSDSACWGTIIVSLDSFDTCVQFSGPPTVSNSNKTYTMNLAYYLSALKGYRIAVSTAAKDSSGNKMQSTYVTTNEFLTTTSRVLQEGGSNSDVGYDVTVDSSGNVYTAGYAYALHGNKYNGGSFLMKHNSSFVRQWTRQSDSYIGYNLAEDSSGNIILFSHSGNAFYLTKFTSSGEEYWSVQETVSNSQYFDFAMGSSSDDMYLIGYTTIGSIDGISRTGNADLLLMKYNSSVTRQWAKLLGVSGKTTYGYGLDVDSSGNIYATGFTSGNLDNNTNAGNSDVFLTKYNTSGTKQWTKLFGSSSSEVGNKVALDGTGYVYITGYTDGILDGGSVSGDQDVFIAKYNTSGTQQWIKQLGDTYSEGKDIVVDSAGNVYVTGNAYGDFDGNKNLGGRDIIVVKYNSSGTKQWSKQYGTSSTDLGIGITLDSSGYIYITGQTSGGLYGNTTAGNNDIFVMKLDSSGTIQ